MTALGTTISPALSGACNPAISELDYVLANLDANFANWRGKRIVLHGVREYAQAIVEAFDDAYHFAAVVANDENLGASMFGKETWSNERMLDEKPNLVILTERVRHAEAVYQEIGAACREAGIDLFDMYGIDWLAMRDEIDRQYAGAIDQWIEIADSFDAVSFEVPDCLMETNLQASSTLLACKPHMHKLVECLRTQGKRVLFVGRGPFTAEAQLESLEASGLIPPEDDIRSLFFMRAGEDGTWRTIRAAYPNARILHIGYGIAKECVLPRYYGIDTYRMVGEIAGEDMQLDIDALARESLDPSGLRARLAAAIEHADAVSFDVFDTLLVRKTLSPGDVFELAERRALEQGLLAEGFAVARSAAQLSATDGTAEHIYRIVQKTLGCSDANRDALYEIELDIERESIIPREPLHMLLRKVHESGRKVFLVSDMYHSADTIAMLLKDNGIVEYDQLFVSCEHGVLKRQGLFDVAASAGIPADRIVHVGDSILNDIGPAEAAGIKAILVPSPLDIALAHGLNRAMRKDMPLSERCDLGRRIVSEFANPFKEQPITVAEGAPTAIPDARVAEFSAWMSNTAFLEKAVVHIAPCDSRIPIELRRALLAWYPFPDGGTALFLGSDREAFMLLLEERFDSIDSELAPDKAYSCIIVIDPMEGSATTAMLMKRLAAALEPNGVLVVGFRNRFGIKYLCGAVDAAVREPFATLDNEGRCGTYGKTEMQRLLKDAGLQVCRTYYAMPDPSFVQAVYTDDYIPRAGIHDRVMPFDAYVSPLVAAERNLYPAVVEEGMLPAVANYFVMECRRPNAALPAKQVVHAALSLDREPTHSFITTLFTDGTALKAAARPESREALEAICANSYDLRKRGIATVDAQMADDGLHMPFVHEQPLLEYLDSLLPDEPDAFIAVFDQLFDDILASSEAGTVSDTEAQRTWHASPEHLGSILQTGYIDMVPYNAFWADGTLRYFDQEFTIENCPAKYVLFRALRYTWIHLPHAEQTIPLEHVKKRFGLEHLWGSFTSFEDRFVEENRNRNLYQDIYGWARPDTRGMAERRRALARLTDAEEDKPYGIGLLMGVFDLFHVGHLRLIKRAKARCRFLRVAVLSDELVRQYKGITPTIPLAQRMEVLASIEGVDEVVAIEDNPSRIMEWNRRPFDCFFSGDDYAGNDYWAQERRELEKLGATIEFFPYTEEQSSTNIRRSLG